MKRLLFASMLLAALSGCEFLLTNIDGWDLSACGSTSTFGVCYELFSDNQEKILGGRSGIDAAMDVAEGWTE